MTDGEGTVNSSGFTRYVAIANTDDDLIQATKDALSSLGIAFRESHRRQPVGRKPVTYITIHGRENLQRFERVVPIQARRKRDLLRASLASYRYGRRPRFTYPGEDRLRELYEVEEMSTTEMAHFLQTSPMAILRWMKRAGIARRTISEAKKVKWRQVKERWPTS